MTTKEISLNGKTAEGYLGATAWIGDNSRKGLFGAELTKAMRDTAKQVGLKGVTFKCNSFSGGQSVKATLKMKENDFFDFEDVENEYKNLAYNRFLHYGWIDIDNRTLTRREFERMKKSEQETIMSKNGKELYERDLNSDIYNNDVTRDTHPAYTEGLVDKLNLLVKVIKSYNYNDSNAMVDYFNTNFYWEIRVKAA